MFTYILAFEEFTGGGGDGDENPDDEDAEKDNFESRLGRARQQGCSIGNLSLKTYKKWQDKGWYDLFHAR
jgi:hypothetical protein